MPPPPWEKLPAEVWALLLASLTGAELLRLSHSGGYAWRLLRADESLWRQRVLGAATRASALARPPAGSRSWREAFARHRVLRFPGLRVDCMADDKTEGPRAFVEARARPESARWWVDTPSRLSIDAWICLLPSQGRGCDADGERFPGGVVLAQQSSSCASPSWPHVRANLMLVDATGHLVCSVLDGQHYKVRRLTVGRWYHVALTYARYEYECAEEGYQCVYVDGELSSSLSGQLHRDWQRMTHFQVGTGYVAAGLHACPREDFRGWYGLNGLVDELRIWDELLSESDVRQLAAMPSPELVWSSDSVWFSMLRDGSTSAGVARAKLSRPSEGRWAR